jgi:hypothetical protein
LPAAPNRAALAGMGAKYLPTKKDLKASQRYQNNHHPLPHTRKSSVALPKEKGKVAPQTPAESKAAAAKG